MKFSVSELKGSPLLITILVGLAAFGIFSTSIYLPSMITIANDLGSSQTLLQLTLTTFFLGSAMGQIILGPVSDHYGRLKVAYGGILVFAISSVACTMVTSVEQLILWRFIHGMSASVGPLLSRAIARDMYSGVALAKVASTTMLVISISPAIAPVVGGYLQLYFDWHASFYFLAISGIFLLALILFKMPETNVKVSGGKISIKKSLKNYLIILSDRRFFGFSIILGSCFCGVFIFITMYPFIFERIYKWNPQEYAWVMSMLTIGNMAGFSLARKLTGSVKPEVAIALSMKLTILASGLYLGLNCWTDVPSWSLLLFIVIFTATTAIGLSNAMAAAMNIHPNVAGAAAAVIGSVQIGSGAVGSLIAGLLPDSLLMLSLSMGATILFGFSSYLWLIRKSQ